MSAIYRSASLVFSHLREPDLLSQQVLASAVKRVVKNAEAQKRAQMEAQKQARIQAKMVARERREMMKSRSIFQKIIGTSPDYPEVPKPAADAPSAITISLTEETAMLRFLDHPYWLRAWIIQEVSVNPQLMIVWGSQEFDFGQIVKAFSDLATRISIANRWEVWCHINQLYEVRTSQLALKPLSLIQALGLCYMAESRLVQDQVFALLGLTHDGPYLVPAPSYILSTDDISRDMTIRMIRATGNLDIVVLKGHEINTWYPNWFDTRYWHFYKLAQLRLGGPSLLTYTNYGTYRSSGKHISTLKIVGKSVVVKGFFIGSIAGCSPSLTESKASGLPATYILQPRAWKYNSRDEFVFRKQGFQEVKKTLHWLLVDITKPSPGNRESIQGLRKLLHENEKKIMQHAPSLLQWLNCCEDRGFEIHGQPFVKYFSMEPKYSKRWAEFQEDCNSIERNLGTEMRLGYTSEGQMGWFHGKSRVGDKVAILLGSSMPCVLRVRPRGGYKLLGECIVDGVMQGEAVKNGIKALQDIQLN
jgi:hypothetical protein